MMRNINFHDLLICLCEMIVNVRAWSQEASGSHSAQLPILRKNLDRFRKMIKEVEDTTG